MVVDTQCMKFVYFCASQGFLFPPPPPSDMILTLISGRWRLVSAHSCSYCGSLTILQGYIPFFIFCCCSDINNVRLCYRSPLQSSWIMFLDGHCEPVFYFVKWMLNGVLIYSVKFNIPINLSPAVAVDGKAFELCCCFDRRSPELIFLTDLFSRPPPSFTPCWVVVPSGRELPAIWHMPVRRTSCPHHPSLPFEAFSLLKYRCYFFNPLQSCDDQLVSTPATNDRLFNEKYCNTKVTCGRLWDHVFF